MSTSSPSHPRASDASGTLERTPFAQLLAYAVDKRLSGTFEFLHATDGERTTLVTVEGQVLKVRSTGAPVYLGQLLFELGHLDAEALNQSLLALSRREGLHGAILLKRGAIQRGHLREGLEAQTARKVHPVFGWPRGSRYDFWRGDDLLRGWGGDDFPPVDALRLLWRGVREFPALEHVEHTLARVGDGFCGIIPAATLERFGFEGSERALVDCLRARPMSVGELAATGIAPEATCRLLVYVLLLTKQVAFADPRRMSDPNLPAAFRSVPAMRAPTASQVSAAAAANASPGAPRGGRPSAPGLPAARPSVGGMAAVRPSVGGMAAVRPSAGGMPATRPSAPAIPAARPPSHPTVRIEPASAGTTRAAVPAEAQGHPSSTATSAVQPSTRRMSIPGVAAVSPEALRDASPAVRAAAMDRELEGANAHKLFTEAEIALQRKDLDRAERLCKRAHALETEKAEYLALLAWVEAQRPDNQAPAALKQRIQMLDRALSFDPKCERAYFYRANLHKKTDNHGAAFRDFRLAARLNPRNVDAVREVRLYEMRGQKATSSSGEHAFGRVATPSPDARRSSKDIQKPPQGLLDRLLNKKP